MKMPKEDGFVAMGLRKRFPRSAANMRTLEIRYSCAVARAHKLEKDGRILVIAPESTEGINTLAKNRAAFDRLYRRGLADAEKIPSWLNG